VTIVKPIRLTPSLREKVWGRSNLRPFFPDSEKPIGEVWYLSERELPLLVKLIFTSERLSVQVHPDDGEAGPRGKTEMWHILEAAEGAAIALGFREPITRELLRQAACAGGIESLLNWVPVRAGETYFTPAHTVHAIGAGVVLCEIQQNSDVTYRLWDYGRPREIHVEQAAAIADLGVHPGVSRPIRIDANRTELARCRHFVTEMLTLSSGAEYSPEPRECHLLIALEGGGEIADERFGAGEVWLLPEDGVQPVIRASGPCRLLKTYVPAR
jgi:mannose-6-phosphate isomerase